MTRDHICIDGRLTSPDSLQVPVHVMMSSPFVYQDVHTFDHRPAYLSEHLNLLKEASAKVFGKEWRVDTESVESQISELLSHNRYPRQSNHVRMYVFGWDILRGADTQTFMVEGISPMFYPKYVVWHKRVIGDIFCTSVPFAGCQTSWSLNLSSLFNRLAVANDLDRGIIVTPDDVCFSSGDQPIFVVKDKIVYTTPVRLGAPDTVMRRLVMDACRDLEIDVRELPVSTDMLSSCDEVFSCDVQGLVDFLGIGNSRLFNFTVKRIQPYINRLTWGG